VNVVPLRIGHIEYANCAPIFAALRRLFDCGTYQFIRDVPSRLNRMLAEGAVDLCPSSSLEYGRSAGNYLLLPDLSISSVGPVKSVFLFSRLPLEHLDGKHIGLSSESETSVALLKILLRKYYGFSNSFFSINPSDYSNAFDSCCAVLLIGNTAMKWNARYENLYRYDLGELWYSFTRLPFVFALWMIRKEFAVARREEALLLSSRLLAAKRASVSMLEELAAECEESSWMSRDSLIDYWENISYDLTSLHVSGVKTFFHDAVDVGVLRETPEISFLQLS
jgi:chorismate dehydratase